MPQDPTHPANSVIVSKVEPTDPTYDAALGFALTGCPDRTPALEGQRRSLELLHDRSGVKTTVFIANDVHGVIQSAVLQLESPGRSVLVYLPPVDLERVPLTATLEAAIQHSKERKLNILQTLLRVGDSKRARLLSDLGFRYLAELIYMECGLGDSGSSRSGLSGQFRIQTYSPELEPTFLQALECSYEDSQDCPALTPLRSVQDAFAGTKATGVFDPSGFYVVMDGTAPIAILLTSCVVDRPVLEVVYMGVLPAGRRRGLGSGLLSLAKARARELGLSGVILAVDGVNEPARRLYTKAGFVEQTRRRAWIRTV